MSNEHGLKVGDKVRITSIGYVGYASSAGADIYTLPDQEGRLLGSSHHYRVESIEKIEPPVVRFGPGDVVRRRSDGNYLALGDEGWVNLTTGRTYVGHEFQRNSFTSRSHERASVR